MDKHHIALELEVSELYVFPRLFGWFLYSVSALRVNDFVGKGWDGFFLYILQTASRLQCVQPV